MKKNKFNAIIFRDKDTDGFVYVPYERCKQGEAYNIKLGKGFLPDERQDGVFPKNKIVLASVRTEGSEIGIIPIFCVDIELRGMPISFWDMAENSEYLGYFIQEISKKLSKVH